MTLNAPQDKALLAQLGTQCVVCNHRKGHNEKSGAARPLCPGLWSTWKALWKNGIIWGMGIGWRCFEMLWTTFSRMRSEGFPFIVWGSGGWTRPLFASSGSSGRRRVIVGSGRGGSCVAGVALCDIPTLLIMCRKCQNWRVSRTKCSCCCTHVSRLESLVFLWRRRVYGGSCKTSPFRKFPSSLSCQFVVQSSTGKCFVQAV